MDEVTIRSRRPADLDQCVEVLALVHAADSYPMRWPCDPRRFLSPAGALATWVAVTDGTVVGHVMLETATALLDVESRDRPLAGLHRLFVRPGFRSRGVGFKLLDRATQWATDWGYDLILEVVDEENSAAAIDLYERTGWRHAGTSAASWSAPGGEPVTVRRYVFPVP